MTRPLTRRDLLERTALSGAVLTLPGFAAACGGGIESEEGDEGTGTVERRLAGTLRISNWPLYIDIDEKTKKRPTLQQFQKEFGVNVRYIEDVNDNDEFFGKVQAPLKNGQSIDRDIVVLTDWMAGRMVRLGYVEKVDKETLADAENNLVDALRSPGWDPNRDYSLPWQSGLTGIGYDSSKTGGPVTSVSQLLEDSKLKGKVAFLTEMPD